MVRLCVAVVVFAVATMAISIKDLNGRAEGSKDAPKANIEEDRQWLADMAAAAGDIRALLEEAAKMP
ncbi:hypothetical protein AAL_03277 [Moelleriella libera RCEF 2490]|uniref:Uncharacterized protein n=1 Tax=Moelleriella libera RCEF 2490 TaxID=1081109 RepID=A0A168D3I1_9HYPO|nr:hypothetical protein AAL_03277 [Moelleriella libera RCEF 2490]